MLKICSDLGAGVDFMLKVLINVEPGCNNAWEENFVAASAHKFAQNQLEMPL